MKLLILRIINLLTGLFLFALGIVITIKANIGYTPWDVFHMGLSGKTGLSLGTISIIVGMAIVILVTILREKLGLGTVLNMLLIGIFIDLLFPHIPVVNSMIIGILVLIGGLLTMSFGSYFYIKSAFGVGPRDNLMVVLTRKTKLPVGLCRIILEFLVTVTGWFLGGMVGFGTIISVIAMGFCIQTVFRLFKFDITSVKHETLKDTFITFKNTIAGKKELC